MGLDIYFSPIFQQVSFVTPEVRMIYEYQTDERTELVLLQPVFDQAKTLLYSMNVPENLQSEVLYSNRNTPQATPSASAEAAAPSGWYAAEVAVDNPNPIGGFSTEAEANTVGQRLAGTLTYNTYRQPEGTFSYVIARETNLVCNIKPSSMMAKAWLLGGG